MYKEKNLFDQKEKLKISERERELNELSEKAVRIFLTEEQRESPLEKLMEEYNISKATASRARKRGYFCRGGNYSQPKDFSKIPVQETIFKKTISLTKEERQMSTVELAKKYNIGENTALESKKRGWVLLKGRQENILLEGGLPEGVAFKDVEEYSKIAVTWAIKKLHFRIKTQDDFKDAVQEGLLRLMHETANPNFIFREWRKKIVYLGALKVFMKKMDIGRRERKIEIDEEEYWAEQILKIKQKIGDSTFENME